MKHHLFHNTSLTIGGVTLYNQTDPEHNDMSYQNCLDSNAILSNRKKLAEELGIPLENWVLSIQEHTDHFHEVTSRDIGKGSFSYIEGIPSNDALYTTLPEVLIGAMTADCLGLCVIDETTPCVAVIHSGWKGTLQSITTKVVSHLLDKGLIHPETTQVYLSPTLHFDSLEMGQEVIDQFIEAGFDLDGFLKKKDNGKYLLDNEGLNMAMLERLGITQITRSNWDTLTDTTNTFSHRRKQKGRHMTYAFIKESVLQ